MSPRPWTIVAAVGVGLAWLALTVPGCRATAGEPPAAPEPEAGVSIRGRVVGAPPGLAVKVAFRLADDDEDERSVPCAPDGSFAIDGLDPAHAPLWLTARGDANSAWTVFSPSLSPPVRAEPGTSGVELRLPPAATYRLRVVDAATQAPLDDVELAWLELGLLRESGRPRVQRSPAPGAYELGVVFRDEQDNCAVQVTRAGYQGLALGGRRFAPGETHDFGTVELAPPQTMLVRVCDDRDGSPVAGARLTLQPEITLDCANCAMGASWPARSELAEDGAGTTGVDGSARVAVASGQSYWLSVEHDGFPAHGERLSTEPRPPAELALYLESGGALVVTCLDADSLVPLANATIAGARGGSFSGWRDERTQMTGTDGRTRFANLVPGTYRFWPAELEPAGYAREIEVASAVERALTLTRPSPPDGMLYGIVSDGGRPLAGATVTLGEEATLTDRDGVYEFRGLARGEFELGVTHPRFGPVLARRVTLSRDDTQLDLALELAPLEGVVRGRDGAPLAGVELSLGERAEDGRIQVQLAARSLEPLCSTTSGADGRFRYAAVQARDDLALVLEHEGFLPARLGPLTLPHDGTALVLAPVLERAETLVVVVPSAGRASPSWLVRAVWHGAEPLAPEDREQRAVRAGGEPPEPRYLFDRLRAGPWAIEVYDVYVGGHDEPRARAEVTLPRAEATPLVLHP